ncbi:MAG TPA: efflux RND transporter periplasmic adaptor subunit [Saprospiraceae bacterium]|nr:efflux RND transporter periplasmic adaptor subunit [Saprospiraceae bacterium]HQW56484.1 efflux RND transporter periplasmic adaptor subunit [Saprospiraceae bacterium]
MIKYIIIIIVLFSLLSCTSKSAPDVATENTAADIVSLNDAQLKNTDIQTGILQPRKLASILKVNGVIDVPPQNMVSVSVPLGGYLKSSKLLEGMHVKKGEIIATMEDHQYVQLQQDYLTAKAQLSSIEKEYLRQKDLNESKASSDKVYENAQSVFLTQKVLLRSLEEKLRLIYINPARLSVSNISRSIRIPSPINGFVSEVKINIGKYVSPTEVMFELVNPTDIHLALTVFEKDVDKIFIGQKIMAYNNQRPDKKYPCKVILIGKNLSPERAVTVHCHFDQYDSSLIPGMYMNADLEVVSQDAYAIPNDGLVRYEGKQYVFIVTGEKEYHMQEVTTQHSDSGFTQFTLADGSLIKDKLFVIKGAYTLLMKLKNTEEE